MISFLTQITAVVRGDSLPLDGSGSSGGHKAKWFLAEPVWGWVALLDSHKAASFRRITVRTALVEK